MRLVTPECRVDLVVVEAIEALARVVVPDDAARAIQLACRKAGRQVRVSGLGHYTRHYGGQDLAGKRLLVWRGHGVGDQLIAAGICRIIHDRWPTADIRFYGDPRVWRALWADVPDLPFTPRPEPIPFDEWLAADYHLVLEDMCEVDREPDQPCTWDAMLAAAGLADTPDDRKTCLVPVTDQDRARADEWLASAGCTDGPLVLWQVAASTRIRSATPQWNARAIRRVAEARPDVTVLATGNRTQVAEFAAVAGARLPGNVRIEAAPRLRVAFAAIERAACTVAPDSMAPHAAGGLARPCVSLWASFLPQDRIRYYPRAIPLVGAAPCSPCRTHECGGQPEGCPLFPGEYCRGLAAIAPAQAADAVLAVLPPPAPGRDSPTTERTPAR